MLNAKAFYPHRLSRWFFELKQQSKRGTASRPPCPCLLAQKSLYCLFDNLCLRNSLYGVFILESRREVFRDVCSNRPVGFLIVPLLYRRGGLAFSFPLRHTFSTLALQNGVDIKTVSDMLGNYSAGFTLDTYAHVTTAAQKEAAKTMGNLLSGSI